MTEVTTEALGPAAGEPAMRGPAVVARFLEFFAGADREDAGAVRDGRWDNSWGGARREASDCATVTLLPAYIRIHPGRSPR